jgi:hypothetical protein
LLKEALLPFMETETTAACFHRVGKYCRGKLKDMFKSRYKYIGTNLKHKAMDVIISNRFSWSQALNSYKTPESETGAKDKNSEYDERVRTTTGQGLFYTD